MGRYTIQDEWPVDLKIAAANVIRAKLEKKWRKRNALTCDDDRQFKYCQDKYIQADSQLMRAKVTFEDVKSIYLKEA